jgi:hypothetical protein
VLSVCFVEIGNEVQPELIVDRTVLPERVQGRFGSHPDYERPRI